jgi:hypothetical protein
VFVAFNLCHNVLHVGAEAHGGYKSHGTAPSIVLRPLSPQDSLTAAAAAYQGLEQRALSQGLEHIMQGMIVMQLMLPGTGSFQHGKSIYRLPLKQQHFGDRVFGKVSRPAGGNGGDTNDGYSRNERRVAQRE